MTIASIDRVSERAAASSGARAGNDAIVAARGLRGLNLGCGAEFASVYDRSDLLNADMASLCDAHGTRSSRGDVVVLDGRHAYLEHDATAEFPLASRSFDWIFCEHFIEHIEPYELGGLLAELRRLARPGGTIRLSTPDLALYMAGYVDPEQRFFRHHHRVLADYLVNESAWARRANQPVSAEQARAETRFWRNLSPEFEASSGSGRGLLQRLTGVFDTAFARRAVMVNQIFRFYGHRWLYDHDELRYWAEHAGFAGEDIVVCGYREGRVPELCALDQPFRRDESLYVELHCGE
jgi:predicted SAM-dependent methyltransferase